MPLFEVDTEFHDHVGPLWIMEPYEAEDEADALHQNAVYWAGKKHVRRPMRVTVKRAPEPIEAEFAEVDSRRHLGADVAGPR